MVIPRFRFPIFLALFDFASEAQKQNRDHSTDATRPLDWNLRLIYLGLFFVPSLLNKLLTILTQLQLDPSWRTERRSRNMSLRIQVGVRGLRARQLTLDCHTHLIFHPSKFQLQWSRRSLANTPLNLQKTICMSEWYFFIHLIFWHCAKVCHQSTLNLLVA